MVQHFQARIDRARNEADAQERDIESFQTAVRNLLDYRQWFQFRLYCSNEIINVHRWLSRNRSRGDHDWFGLLDCFTGCGTGVETTDYSDE